MEVIKLFAIFILISAVLLLSAEGREMIFDDIRRNKLVNSSMIIKTISTQLLIKCQQHCVYNENCWSVHFNEDLNKCKLSKFSIYSSGRCGEVIGMEKISGWIYYGTKQENIKTQQYEIITDTAYCSPNERRVVKNTAVTTFPTLRKQWELSIKIRPNAVATTEYDVIFLASFQPNPAYGYRNPGVFFEPHTTKPYLVFSLDNIAAYGVYIHTNLPIGVYSTLVIMQYLDQMDGKYYVNVIIDGIVHMQLVNKGVREFQNVQLLCGDAIHLPANVTVKDLLFRTW